MITVENIQTLLLSILARVGLAIMILIVGRWLAHRVREWVRPLLKRTRLTASLIELTIKIAYFGIQAVALLIALPIIGVPITSVIAVSGVALVLLGIALQESIGNFAATVIFLLFEPFAVGDLVEIGDVMGTVEEIQLFNTVVRRADNRIVTLPNAKIQGEGVTNYSKLPHLRVDLTVGISYDDDIDLARSVAMDLLRNDTRVLTDPPPRVVVLDLGDSSVNLGIRPFVRSEDYWEVLWDLTETIKTRFDQAGLSIPYPQQDIYLHTPSSATVTSDDEAIP